MKQPKRIGKCIYCGTTNPPLTDEHVIPYGLNGDVKLLEASCQECAKITSRFERIILRDSLFVLRAALGSKTRNKKERDVERPMVIVKEGVRQTIEAHWKDHWKVIHLPVFKPPAFLDGRAYGGGIEITHVEVITIPETPGETLKKHDADDVIHRLEDQLKIFTAYAKLLAKIGYGLAVQNLGMDAIEDAHLVRGMLGQSNDLGRWVGCDGQRIISSTQYQHCETRLDITNGVIVVRVRLFDGTEYIVVVGRFREAVK